MKKKKATKKQSKIVMYGYAIERDFVIISGGGLTVLLLTFILFIR